MILFGTDFDDTLYFHKEGGIRQEDIEAIRHFQQEGNLFGLVSGRGRVMWPDIAKSTDGQVDFDFKIFSNGSCICDREGKILKEWFLPETVVREIYEKYADAGLIFHCEDALHLTKADLGVEGVLMKSIDDIDPSRVYEISYQHWTEPGRKIFAENQDRKDVIMVSNSQYTDFCVLGCTKGSALNYIAHTLHDDHDTSAAIGDSWNDITMLKDADVSFTFRTSPHQVQEAATHLVSGIAEAIEILDSQQ